MICGNFNTFINKKGYRVLLINGKPMLEHRHIFRVMRGMKIPQGYQIHHRDLNKLNNNIDNLQLVTPKQHKQIHLKIKEMN